MSSLGEALGALAADLAALEVRWALVGGLAVSARAEPRTTRDLDVAIAVDTDREAEAIVNGLVARGYRLDTVLEQTATNRMATARLLTPGGGLDSFVADLLFASSGIEPELVARAEPVEMVEGVGVPIALLAHLLALKVLAGRPQDLADAESLLRVSTQEDLEVTRYSLELIAARGYHRGKDLPSELDRIVDGFRSRRGRDPFRPRELT